MGHTLIDTLAQRGVDRDPMLEAAGCGGSCSLPPSARARLAFDAPPIRVDGVVIAEADIAREAQHHEAASMEEARAAAARALILRFLLLARANALALTPAPEMDAFGRWESDDDSLIRQVLETEAPPLSPSREECRRVYDAQRERFSMAFEAAEPIIRDRLAARAWIAASAKYAARLMRAARTEGLLREAGP